MNKIGYIYKITSPTGKIYIGKTVRLNDRISCYRTGSGTSQQRIIHNSIKKYGWDKHIFEVLEEAPAENLSELEIHHIQKYNSYHYENENGMNLTRGGDGTLGRKDTPEVIQKRVDRMRGSKRTEETKKLMSSLKKGKPSHRKGVPCPESVKKKIGDANRGRVKTQEEVYKSKDRRLQNLIKKHEAILQIDPHTNEVVKEWVMLPKDIGRHFTNAETNITKCLNNQLERALKYKWRYKK